MIAPGEQSVEHTRRRAGMVAHRRDGSVRASIDGFGTARGRSGAGGRPRAAGPAPAARWWWAAPAVLLLAGCSTTPEQQACAISERAAEDRAAHLASLVTVTIAIAVLTTLLAVRARGRLHPRRSGLRLTGLGGLIGIVSLAAASTAAPFAAVDADTHVTCDDGSGTQGLAGLSYLFLIPLAVGIAGLAVLVLLTARPLIDGAGPAGLGPLLIGSLLAAAAVLGLAHQLDAWVAAFGLSALALALGGSAVLATDPPPDRRRALGEVRSTRPHRGNQSGQSWLGW